MGAPEYSRLIDALRTVPDPRHARGRRHAWGLILTVISAARLSGQRNVRAIGQWADERREELCALLQPPPDRLPSPATLRRASRAVLLPRGEVRQAGRYAVTSRRPPRPRRRNSRPGGAATGRSRIGCMTGAT